MSLGNLAKYLVDKRKSSGLTQKELALKLGYISPQFVSNWERGLSAPPIGSLKKIASILNTSADDLFSIFLEDTLATTREELVRQYHISKRK